MIADITNWIVDSLRVYGPWSVFIGVMIEQIIIPIPSPLIIMGAGAVLITATAGVSAIGQIVYLIVIPGSIAATLGGFLTYAIGFWGGRPVVERFEKYLGFGWRDVDAMRTKFFNHRSGWAIFFLRALPIVPLSLISIAAGAIRMPMAGFAWWTLLGSLPRCLILAYLGWLMKDAYLSMAQRLNFIETLISAAIVAGSLGVIIWLRKKMRSQIG